MSDKPQKLPLHDWLLWKISGAPQVRLGFINDMILDVKIPTKHQEIADALSKRAFELGLAREDISDALRDLQEQKHEAEAKVSAQARAREEEFNRLVPYPNDPHERM